MVITDDSQLAVGKVGTNLIFRVGQGRLPQVRLVPAPSRESFCSDQSRGDVCRHHRPFHEQGARTTKRIQQAGLCVGQFGPAGTHQNCRGHVLLKWRRCPVGAGLASIERASSELQAQRELVAFEVRIDPQVGPARIDVRALAFERAKLIDDAIFDSERTVAAVTQPGTPGGEGDAEGTGRFEMRRPRNRLSGLVKTVFVGRAKAAQSQQQSVCQAGPDADSISGGQRRMKEYPGASLAGIVRTERLQFNFQEIDHAPGRRGKESMGDFGLLHVGCHLSCCVPALVGLDGSLRVTNQGMGGNVTRQRGRTGAR